MNDELSNISDQEQREYYSLLRNVLSEEYQDYSNPELEELIESATSQIPEKEAEEFFGLLTGIATAVAPSLIKGIGGLFKRRRRKRRHNETLGQATQGQIVQEEPAQGQPIQSHLAGQGQPAQSTTPQQPPLSQNDALRHLTRMIRNPQFLATLAGSFINNALGRRIGKVKTRIVVQKGALREVNDITLPAYMNALSYLAQKAAGGTETIGGRQEFSYLTDENGNFRCNPFSSSERAELLVTKLFGVENERSESWESDDYASESDWSAEGFYEDEFQSYEHEAVNY